MVIFYQPQYNPPMKVVKTRITDTGNLISNLICDYNGSRFLMTIVVRPLDGKP